MIAALHRYLAARRLQRLVDANKRSPACREYARRRAAALKGSRG